MRAERGRTKKLRAAFHFERQRPGEWKCGECRRQGLEERRGCGFLRLESGKDRVVWSRRGLRLTECPVSYISGASRRWLEWFGLCVRLGFPEVGEMAARDAEAMALLWDEWRKEIDDEQRRAR